MITMVTYFTGQSWASLEWQELLDWYPPISCEDISGLRAALTQQEEISGFTPGYLVETIKLLEGAD